MKAKDLAKELLKHPEFEIEVCTFNESYHWIKVTGIADIGYSDKRIILDTEEFYTNQDNKEE